jgi:hypothetical protein
VLGNYNFRPEYRTDNYWEQRGLEQVLYNRHPEAMLANGGFNKIRAIREDHPLMNEYMDAALRFIRNLPW